jgi:hypothetical protein
MPAKDAKAPEAEPTEDLYTGPQPAGGFEGMVGSSGDTTSIAVPTEDTGSPIAPVWTSTPDFEEGETGYPLLRLAQGLTPEVAQGDAKMGDWLLNGFEPMKDVTIIPMFFARTRRMNDPNDRTRTLCASGDGVTGRGTPGGNCHTCPMAQWSEDPRTGRRRRPPCDLQFNYGAYSVEHEQVVQVGFKGTGTGAAQSINNFVQTQGMGKFAMKLTSSTERNGPNIYAVPTATMAKMRSDVRSTVSAIMNPQVVDVEVDDYDPPEDALPVVESTAG